MSNIRFEKIGDSEYEIYDGSEDIGTINYFMNGKILLLGSITVWSKGNGYGLKIIDYILKEMNVQAIVGQSVKASTGFWDRCIREFNGARVNYTTYGNCPFSFIIPDIEIKGSKLVDYIQMSSQAI